MELRDEWLRINDFIAGTLRIMGMGHVTYTSITRHKSES